MKSLSRVRLFATLWTIANQSSLSMGFSRQEYWSGLPFPSPGDLPDPGIEPRSPTLRADALPSEPPGKPTNKDLQYSTWNSAQCHVEAWMGGEFLREWIHVCMTEPLHCSPETFTALLIGYSSVQCKKFLQCVTIRKLKIT